MPKSSLQEIKNRMKKKYKTKKSKNQRQKGGGLLIIIGSVMLIAAVVLIICLNKHSKAPAADINTPEPTADAAPEPTDLITPEPTPYFVENEMPVPRGMVLAGEKLSFGLSTCGLVSFIGSNEGQAYCYNWKDVLQLAGGGKFTAGLDKNGEILLSADEKNFDSDLSSWENVVNIAASEKVLYGLKKDGTVYSSDNSCEDLYGIAEISAGKDFLIALSDRGELFTVGNAPDISAWKDKKIISVAAGETHILALAQGGELLAAGNPENFDSIKDIKDISRIIACGNDSAVITEDGTIYTGCEFIDAPVENAVDFSSAYGHALVLLDDGTVLAFGDNEYLQCNVENWRLRPYADEKGFILGIPPDSGIKTGDQYTLENGTCGTAVILGDISCDGSINLSDKKLMLDFLSGNIELSDVQKRAANIIMDPKQPDAIDIVDSEQLDYALRGFITIDQYAKDFKYSEELAEAERFNPDTVGYINLENTRINYPLMYGERFYYHYHNPAHVSTSRSSVYLYYPDLTKNIAISGHNLRISGLMLHDLHKIQDEYAKDYSEFSKRLWEINVFGETHLWEVFAMYEEKPSKGEVSSLYYNANYPNTMNVMNDEEICEWINYQFERTELDYMPYVSPEDQFMTIFTCADKHAESQLGGRIYFFLRRVDGH